MIALSLSLCKPIPIWAVKLRFAISVCILAGIVPLPSQSMQDSAPTQAPERVMNLDGLQISPAYGFINRYYWLSDTDLLILSGPDEYGYIVTKFNLATKHRTVLSSSFISSWKKSGIGISTPEVSADGKWVLWSNNAGGLSDEVNTCLLDGSHYSRAASTSRPYWCQDGHHYMTFTWFTSDRSLVVHDVLNPSKVTKLPISRDSPIARIGLSHAFFPSISRAILIRCTAYDANRDRSDSASSGEINELDLNHGAISVSHSSVQFPVGSIIITTAVSASGGIAWLVRAPGRVGPNDDGVRQSNIVVIYVSRLDGGDLRPVVRLDNVNPLASESVNEMKWVPGGKYLSYVYKESLWKVGTALSNK